MAAQGHSRAARVAKSGASCQPGSAIYSSNPLMRHMSDWYYMRLIIQIAPRRASWWRFGVYCGLTKSGRSPSQTTTTTCRDSAARAVAIVSSTPTATRRK